MSEYTTNYLTSFVVAGCAFIALLVVIPAASAASNRIRPGWRAWVWPLVFLTATASSVCDGIAIMRREHNDAGIVQLTNLLVGLTLHWIILNSFYRSMPNFTARFFAPFLWAGYILFVLALLLTNSFLAVTIYEVVCGVVIGAVYSTAYVRDRDLAADALPILIGLALSVVGALINSFEFHLKLVFITLGNAAFFHLFQAIAVFFFMFGGNASYGVKYAAQRRREREEELLGTNSNSSSKARSQ